MSKIGVSALSNISTKIISLLSIYIFIPLYIKILGESSYGLISFFATLQTTLNILGLGLSNTLRREFAVGSLSIENNLRKYKLLRSTEFIYILIGLLIVIICILFSDLITQKWLNIESLDPSMVSSVIILMGVSVACQLIANLYSGCLFGLDFQLLANTFGIGWSLVKSIGSLVVITYISQNLIYFYAWHILSDSVYLLVLRISTIKKITNSCKNSWKYADLRILKPVLNYTWGILLISIVALINRQFDKVIISKFLSLTELGAYSIAFTLGSLTAIIPSSIYVAIFPRFTFYATSGNQELLAESFLSINKLVNIFVSCFGAYIAVYSKPLIYIWTGSETYVGILGVVGSMLVLGLTILEFQEMPHALALAHGNTKINVIIGLVFLPIVIALTYLGIKNFGLFGAGLVFLVLMFLQTITFELFVYRIYLKRNVLFLIFRDTIFPLVLSLVFAIISKLLIREITTVIFSEIVLAVIFGFSSLVLLSIIFLRKKDFLVALKQ